MITSVRFLNDDQTTVQVEQEGTTISVPADTSNRHYQAVLEWIADGNEIEPFWVKTVESLRAKLVEQVSELRWQKEVGGFQLNGNLVRSDERSQNMLVNAISLLNNDPNRTDVNWNLPDGSFATLDLPTLKAMGIAMGAHVQATFDRKKELIDQLNAADTIEALEAINIESGWPT